MTAMEARRRLLMMGIGSNAELYPIGTDILTMYLGRDPVTGRVIVMEDYRINPTTGEVESLHGRSTSETYIPVSESYVYRKGAKRIDFHCYDKDKRYLGGNTNIDTWLPSEAVLSNWLQPGTAYVRCTFLTGSNLDVSMIRTA